MHLSRPNRSVPVQFQQVVLNQLFAYRGSTTLLNWRFQGLERCWKSANDNWGEELVWCLRLLHICYHQFFLLVCWGALLAFLFWPIYRIFILYIVYLFLVAFYFLFNEDRFGLVVQTLMLNSSLQGSEISTTFGIWKSLHCIQIYLLGDHL